MYEMILEKATECFYEKGYAQTTITDITSKLNINEARIYQFFKSKEEILLTIPLEKTKIVLKSLLEHLQGIKGADNKLRKLVWHHISFSQNNREYIAILLLELRPNPKFYSSQAYGLFKEHSNVLLNIIEEGKQEGIFRKEVNARLARDMVFGTLDHITLPWVIFRRESNLLEKCDDVCDLFLNALKKGRQTTDSFEPKSKKDLILSVSTELFSKKGFNQSRVSEIANLAGIAESTIYEYFKNKEDILLNIPKRDLELFISNLEELISPKGPENKLRKLIWYSLNHFQNNREYTTILLLELRPNLNFYQSHAYESMMKKYSILVLNIIEEGKKEGIFRAEVNGRLARSVIFGTLDHVALPWIIFKRQSNLLEKSGDLCDLLLNAIKTRN